MKKIILLVMSIIFSMCALVGCGYDTTATYNETTNMPYSAQKQDDSNSLIDCDYFQITKDEFVSKYNEVFRELNENDIMEDAYSEILKENKCSVEASDEPRIPNATKMYRYDQTMYSYEKPLGGTIYKELKIYTDENENCVAVALACSNNMSDPALSFQIDTVCRSAYIAITSDESYDNYIASTEDLQKGYGYEYAFTSDNKTIMFTIAVGDGITQMLNKK